MIFEPHLHVSVFCLAKWHFAIIYSEQMFGPHSLEGFFFRKIGKQNLLSVKQWRSRGFTELILS